MASAYGIRGKGRGTSTSSPAGAVCRDIEKAGLGMLALGGWGKRGLFFAGTVSLYEHT
jgi:hypothetical protein